MFEGYSSTAEHARTRAFGSYVAETITMRLFGASSDGLLANARTAVEYCGFR